jgi:hypothetical protein
MLMMKKIAVTIVIMAVIALSAATWFIHSQISELRA